MDIFKRDMPRIDNRPADERLESLMRLVEHLRDLKHESAVLRYFDRPIADRIAARVDPFPERR